MRLHQLFVNASDWLEADKYEFHFSDSTWYFAYSKLHPVIINKLEE